MFGNTEIKSMALPSGDCLREALLALPEDCFEELEDHVESLIGSCASDETLAFGMSKEIPAWIAPMIETLACGDREKIKLLAVRHWLIGGWPALKNEYYNGKDRNHEERDEETREFY